MNKTFLGDAALNSVQNAIARKKIKDLESNTADRKSVV